MKNIYIVLIALFFSLNTFSQNDIPIVEDFGDEESEGEVVEKTFPAIRIFNLHTTDLLPKGEMKVYIAHRMGQIGTGIDGLYGLNTANSRIGADLGLIKKVTLGIGATSQQNLYGGYLKTVLVRQTSGASPVSIGLLGDATLSFAKNNYPESETWQKMSYTSQMMVSHYSKIGLSVQGMFGIVHKNMVKSADDKNTMLVTGLAANYKIGRKMHLAFEYTYFPKNQVLSTKVSEHILSLGVQIQTGPRHVFQIFISNSGGINEKNVFTETSNDFNFDTIRICFNIPTTFKLYH